MIVTWLGHSCFLLKSDKGLSLLLDPFHGSDVGYALPITEADIVIISHDHLDHNNVDAAGSEAEVIACRRFSQRQRAFKAARRTDLGKRRSLLRRQGGAPQLP